MLTDQDVEITDREYGKHMVKLLRVERDGLKHTIKEVEVNTRITLNDTKDFVRGDNSDIIATDTQKNTVYILAKQEPFKTIEDFALRLTKHFLTQYAHVTDAYIYIEEKPWKRIVRDGKEHNHAFIEQADGTRYVEVRQSKFGLPRVKQGIKDMKVLKTTQSAFTNFHRDQYRSLPDADDRIFCTIVAADWDYDTVQGVDFTRAWETVKDCIIDAFAGNPETGEFSPSVQKTIYDTQKNSLSKIPQMSRIQVVYPNVHAYEFDLARYPHFGFKSNGEVFQPTDKPSGNIRSTLTRKKKAKL